MPINPNQPISVTSINRGPLFEPPDPVPGEGSDTEAETTQPDTMKWFVRHGDKWVLTHPKKKKKKSKN